MIAFIEPRLPAAIDTSMADPAFGWRFGRAMRPARRALIGGRYA